MCSAANASVLRQSHLQSLDVYSMSARSCKQSISDGARVNTVASSVLFLLVCYDLFHPHVFDNQTADAIRRIPELAMVIFLLNISV